MRFDIKYKFFRRQESTKRFGCNGYGYNITCFSRQPAHRWPLQESNLVRNAKVFCVQSQCVSRFNSVYVHNTKVTAYIIGIFIGSGSEDTPASAVHDEKMCPSRRPRVNNKNSINQGTCCIGTLHLVFLTFPI